MKFWNWGPITIWHNMTFGQNCFQKSLHPNLHVVGKRVGPATATAAAAPMGNPTVAVYSTWSTWPAPSGTWWTLAAPTASYPTGLQLSLLGHA